MTSASSSRPTKFSRFLEALGLPRIRTASRQPSNAPMTTTTQSMVSSSTGGAPVSFQLSPSCVLKIQMGDMTKWSMDGSTDAIVNSTNIRMVGGGGVDGAIHKAAGPELVEACRKVPEVRRGVRCPTGEARITLGFQLPVSHVIHTVGPIYNRDKTPEVSLRNAHRNCLQLAKETDIQCIAFGPISCSFFGYPYKEASRISISTVKEFANEFKEVHFVFLKEEHYNVWLETAHELL